MRLTVAATITAFDVDIPVGALAGEGPGVQPVLGFIGLGTMGAPLCR